MGAFETTLRRNGDSFVVNGEKFYATGALFAHFIHIGAVDENGNVYLAIAPRGAPGITIIDNWSSFGQRTTASGNVLIENVRVGPEAVIPAYLGGERPSSNGSVSQIIQRRSTPASPAAPSRRRSGSCAIMRALRSIAARSMVRGRLHNRADR